ncbi:MAG: signal peptidase I [Dehalococcoidales bacterium]|nr:signal peptidase I [Dehalococcoidales bacterium]
MKIFLRDVATTIVLAVLIFLAVHSTIQKISILTGSMEPTLPVGEHLIINKIVYRFHEPERGDIIVFHPPSPHDLKETPYIKRIIGLPGESIEVNEGTVYVHKADGTVLSLDEPYTREPARYPFTGRQIPENEYFVLGDNRNNSGDSREGWTVPRSNIIGKAWLVVWPLSEWGFAPNYPLESQAASTKVFLLLKSIHTQREYSKTG